MSAFDKAWHIGEDEAPAVFEIANAKVWDQGGEWVICCWDVGFADDIKESRFANAWETDQTGIGQKLEFKDESLLFAWVSVFGDAWDSMAG